MILFGVRCEWHGIKPDFVKRAGMDAPRRPLLWHRFIIRPHPIPMLLCIRRGRRDASTFILDRAAPFSGRLGKPSLPIRAYSRAIRGQMRHVNNLVKICKNVKMRNLTPD